MNAISGTIVPAGARQFTLLEEAHISRSKIVEMSAAVERQIWALLQTRDGNHNCSPKALLSKKIETLRQAVEEKKQPAKGDKKVLELLAELVPLADLRSELVHSTMSQGALEGQPVVVLKNAGETHPTIDRRVIVTIDALKSAHQRLSRISNQLKQLAS